MKFFAGLLSIAGFITCMSASAVASTSHAPASKTGAAHAPAKVAHPAAPKIKVAPADEYFGHLKMSILGIRNTLKDLALKADYNQTNAEQIFGSAAFAEEALREWEHKYPRDPWLAKTVAGLVHMYSKVPTVQGRAKMHAALAWLTGRYGSTKNLIDAAKAEADAADKISIVDPAAAATAAPAPSNAPAPAATNAPAPPAKS